MRWSETDSNQKESGEQYESGSCSSSIEEGQAKAAGEGEDLPDASLPCHFAER